MGASTLYTEETGSFMYFIWYLIHAHSARYDLQLYGLCYISSTLICLMLMFFNIQKYVTEKYVCPFFLYSHNHASGKQ